MSKTPSFLQELKTVFERKHVGANDPVFESPSRLEFKKEPKSPQDSPVLKTTSSFSSSSEIPSSIGSNPPDSLRSMAQSIQSERDQLRARKLARDELKLKLAEVESKLQETRARHAQLNESRLQAQSPKLQKCDSVQNKFWQKRTSLLVQSDRVRKELEQLRHDFESSRKRQQTLHNQRMTKIQSEVDEKIHVVQLRIQRKQNARQEKCQKLAALRDRLNQLTSESDREIENIQRQIQQRHEKTKSKIDQLKETQRKELAQVEEPTALLEVEASSLEREFQFIGNEITLQDKFQVAKDRAFEDRMTNLQQWSMTRGQNWQEQHHKMTKEVTQKQTDAKTAQEHFNEDLKNQLVERQNQLAEARTNLVKVLQEQTELRLKVFDLERYLSTQKISGAKSISIVEMECESEIAFVRKKKLEAETRIRDLNSAICSISDDPQIPIPSSDSMEMTSSPGVNLMPKLAAIASLKDSAMNSSMEYVLQKQNIQSQIWHDVTKLAHCMAQCENKDSSGLEASQNKVDPNQRFLDEINDSEQARLKQRTYEIDDFINQISGSLSES